ncbi:MAG: 5-carboxymethyl-2-hydroxymuconate isomerase, partial [Granulosicoccaceae bacterium]
VGGNHEGFISVFANILDGRTAEQKTQRSKAVIVALIEVFPQVPHIELNVNDLLKGTGFNRKAL